MHLPYHESDHVLAIPYNLLAGGTCLQDLDTLRTHEAYLDALGAERIPDPTAEGLLPPFHRSGHLDPAGHAQHGPGEGLAAATPAFFAQAILDADGTWPRPPGSASRGWISAYDGTWGYHPLVLSLANTKEPLYLVNRPGNRPSHEGADRYFDKAIGCAGRRAFGGSCCGGTPTSARPTIWTAGTPGRDVQFCFGIDAMQPIKAGRAVPAAACSCLERPPGIRSNPAPTRPETVKRQIVRQRQFQTIHLLEEMIAEFDYGPVACQTSYRVVVLRKRLGIDKGDVRLREEYRYFFYLTNDRTSAAAAVVFQANDRCDQENLIAQLKSGVRALTTPVDTLISNGAYMVMASVAWSLKAWSALLVPVTPRHAAKHRAEQRAWLRMEFATFRAAVIEMPCQLIRSGGRLIYRLMSWTPWQGVFLRLVERLHGCWLC